MRKYIKRLRVFLYIASLIIGLIPASVSVFAADSDTEDYRVYTESKSFVGVAYAASDSSLFSIPYTITVESSSPYVFYQYYDTTGTEQWRYGVFSLSPIDSITVSGGEEDGYHAYTSFDYNLSGLMTSSDLYRKTGCSQVYGSTFKWENHTARDSGYVYFSQTSFDYYAKQCSSSEAADSIYYILSGEGDDDAIFYHNDEGSPDDPILDDSLGYVVMSKCSWLSDSSYLNGIDADAYMLTWKKKTTTGISLTTDDDYVTRFMDFKLQNLVTVYTDNAHSSVKTTSSTYGEYADLDSLHLDSSNKTTISTIDIKNCFPDVNTLVTNTPGVSDIKQIEQKFRLFYRLSVDPSNEVRVISDNKLDNGVDWIATPWSYLDITLSEDENMKVTQTGGGYFDEDGTFVEDESRKNVDPVNEEHATGTTVEEAQENAENGNTTSSGSSTISDFAAQLKVLVNSIKSIPALLAKVFSFLPSWCLNFVALCLGCMAFVALLKAIL
jgi:hypothetical protein